MVNLYNQYNEPGKPYSMEEKVNELNKILEARNNLIELREYIDSVDPLDGHINYRMISRKLTEVIKLL